MPLTQGLVDLPYMTRKDWLGLFSRIHKSESSVIRKKQTVKGLLAFFEPSTRTSVSFESAGLDLGIQWVRLNAKDLSLQKGESLEDTFKNLSLYDFRVAVVRHPMAGVSALVQSWMKIAVFNAGDGSHAHPSQALGDAYCLWRTVGAKPLTICLFGDVQKSRVARSDIKILTALGHKVFACDDQSSELRDFCRAFKIKAISRRDLPKMQAIICLRTQKERGGQSLLGPLGVKDLGSKALLLHPGPVIVGEDLRYEILQERGTRNLILPQARAAYVVRRFLLSEVL